MKNSLPPRIMIAKPGLDGHDRGAVVIVQALRDAGFDVLYAGFRRTPRQIAIAAAQEDVDGLGLSCHSGAHLPLLQDLCDELNQLAWRPTTLFAGGIIPKEDTQPVLAMGFDFVLGPGTGLEAIARRIRERVPGRVQRTSTMRSEWLRTALQITWLELEAGAVCPRKERRGKVITVAGPGGVGKSTLIGDILRVEATTNRRWAVLANDPVSEFRGGSILVDRLRMPADIDPERILIRSFPVREAVGGIARACHETAVFLAGLYDMVIVETIGIGQNESASHRWSDKTLAVLAPGVGDHWQLRKNALLEICDAVILNKCDLPDAEIVVHELEHVLQDRNSNEVPLVFKASVGNESAVQRLLEAIL